MTNHLCRMVLAGKLCKNSISFPMDVDADFVDKGLCGLTMDSDGYHWKMDEQLVLDRAEAELNNADIDPEFAICLQALNGLLLTQGDSTTTKGNALEPIVTSAMLRFDGMDVHKLPFLVGVPNLPKWTKTTKISLSKSGPAATFDCVDDLEFMKKQVLGGVLRPTPIMQPDFFWYVYFCNLCIA